MIKKKLTAFFLLLFLTFAFAQPYYEVEESETPLETEEKQPLTITTEEKEMISAAYNQLMLKLGALEQNLAQYSDPKFLENQIKESFKEAIIYMIILVIVIQLCCNALMMAILIYFKAKKMI